MRDLLPLDSDRKALLIAALFHDIGKFQYRAEKTTVRHEENSGRFIREHLRGFKALEDALEEAAKLAEGHHQELAHRHLRSADQLSASERMEDETQVARRPLESIFARIQIDTSVPPPSETFSLWPGPLGPECVFPEKSAGDWKEEESRVLESHRNAWEGFLGELANVPKGLDFPGLLHTFHALLERWCTRVTSAAYKAVPDISLFDHLRVTAAYSDCLYLAEDSEKPIVVVEGDLGGIQRFIYRLRTPEGEQKGMAKQLRGRSFYVRLLNDTLANWILDELGLFRPNLILSGGGRFLILAPNRKDTDDLLRRLRQQANEWLLQELHQDLTLALEWESFSLQEMEDFAQVSKRVGQKIERAKQRRASDLLASEQLFGPFEDEKAELEACPICQKLVEDRKRYGGKCRICALHQEMGGAIPRSRYLVEVVVAEVSQLNPDSNRVLVPFPEFGRAWYLASQGEPGKPTDLEAIVSSLPKGARLRITTLGDSQFLSDEPLRAIDKVNGGRGALDFLFLANHLPQEDGQVKDFETIAEEGPSYPYLGFLRADVDDLGFIFSHGFGRAAAPRQDNVSLSRFATLSRELDLFFSCHVNELAKEFGLYITYSGGDDLFVIGHWKNVLDFGRQLYQDFTRFTCENRNVGLSAGLLVEKPNYPIRFAAQEAQEAQEKAKSRTSQRQGGVDLGKRAFCAFDCVHPWERALELLEYGDALVSLVEKDYELRSLVRFILDLSRAGWTKTGVDVRTYPRLRARLYYALARKADVTAESLGDPGADRKVRLFGRLISKPDLFRDFAVVGNYVLLATRRRR